MKTKILGNSKIFSAMAMAMSIYRTLCVLVIGTLRAIFFYWEIACNIFLMGYCVQYFLIGRLRAIFFYVEIACNIFYWEIACNVCCFFAIGFDVKTGKLKFGSNWVDLNGFGLIGFSNLQPGHA